MEDLVTRESFWRGKRVFLTGHTGFESAWLAMWLSELGADVTGYALPPPTDPSLFALADARPVGWVADRLAALWGEGAGWTPIGGAHPHEARYLLLDCSKARADLGWRPRWSLDERLRRTVDWYKRLARGADASELTLGQVREFAGTPAFAPALT